MMDVQSSLAGRVDLEDPALEEAAGVLAEMLRERRENAQSLGWHGISELEAARLSALFWKEYFQAASPGD